MTTVLKFDSIEVFVLLKNRNFFAWGGGGFYGGLRGCEKVCWGVGTDVWEKGLWVLVFGVVVLDCVEKGVNVALC
jgi:hypothetical protein